MTDSSPTTTTTALPTTLPFTSPDIVTQLQLRLDELATQLYAALHYTSTHHPSIASSAWAASVVDPSASQRADPASPGAADAPPPMTQTTASQSNNSTTQGNLSFAQSQSQDASSFSQPPLSPSHVPQPKAAFQADLTELAGDLVSKQREIEGLIVQLPLDVEAAREGQERRIEELEGRQRRVEERRERVLREVEDVIGMFRRV